MQKGMRDGLVYGMGAGALWGMIFLAPALVADFSTVEISAGRYLAFGIVSVCIALPNAATLWRKTTAHDWWLAARLGLVGNLAYYMAISASVHAIGVAASSLIVGTLPVTITLFSRAYGRTGEPLATATVASVGAGAAPAVNTEPASASLRRLFPALALILAGIVCINADLFLPGLGAWLDGSHIVSGTTATLGTPGKQSIDWLQAIFGVGAAIAALAAWTWYALANARGLRAAPRFTNSEWSLLQGLTSGAMAAVVWFALLIAPDVASDVASVAAGTPPPVQPGGLHGTLAALGMAMHATTPQRWLVFWSTSVALAIGASWLGTSLWNAAARRLPLSLSGQMIVFETLFALLFGFLYAQRWPRPLEISAIVLLVVGILWSVRLHRTAH